MRLPFAFGVSHRSHVGAHSVARFRGRGLLIARVIWLAVAVFEVGLFVASLPHLYAGNYTFAANPVTTEGLALVGNGPTLYAIGSTALAVLSAVVHAGIAVLIFWRRSDERMALFTAFLLIMWGAAPNQDHMVVLPPFWQALALLIWFVAYASISPFFYLFPDGRFVPCWTRWLLLIWIPIQASMVLPLPLPSSLYLWNWPFPLSFLLVFGFVGSLGFAQMYRYLRVSNQVQRQQTKWIVFGLFLIVLEGIAGVIIVALFQPNGPWLAAVGGIIFAILRMFVAATFGIAILRYRLWDIDPIINRTLVYGALTACIIGIYVLIVGYLGALFHTSANLVISLVATGVVAVLFQPLRERLQRGVNRLMYGKRDEPYAVISQLGQRLEAALAPDAVLSTIVETVKDALKLPYVAIAVRSENQEPRTENQERDDLNPVVAAVGVPVDDPVRLPLVYQHESVGELLLAPRAPGETFTPADRRLLDDLARQAGVAAHAVRLTTDLQRSRERLVTTREEERRRLRRDLHDGLGPQLAALNLQAGVLRTLIPRDPAAADALVVELRGEIRSAIADIRRLVYELRPPKLDELGLIAAIREQAAQYSTGGALAAESALQVVVDAPDELPPLSAAVEVAAYRIVQEALANVVHHAQARTCLVRLSIADVLLLEITDDGVGLPATHKTGVGLLSMRERAEELGGSCVVERAAEGGTRVLARLPLGSWRSTTSREENHKDTEDTKKC